VRLPRVATREMRFLSAGEVKELAEAADRYEALIYVLAYDSLRWGEAAALRRARCDLLRSRIEVVE
jgi:integrase